MIKKLLNSTEHKLVLSRSSSHSPISLNIVNTEGNGKRIKLSKGLLNQLGNPTEVEFILNEDKSGMILIASENGLNISKGGTIYSAELVQKLTESFNLDFNSHTSHSFNSITIKTDPDDNITYAEITF